MKFDVSVMCFTLSVVCVMPASAGILKCVDADGRIYFSDVACPAEADREYIPAYKSPAHGYRHKQDPSRHYNSVIEQANRMEASRRQSRDEHAVYSGAPATVSTGNLRSKVSAIDKEIEELEHKQLRLREDLTRNASSIRKRWTYEDLHKLDKQQAELQRRRDTLLGIPPARASRDAEAAKQREEQQQAKRKANREAQQAQLQQAEQARQEAQLRRRDVEYNLRREKQLQHIGIWGREGKLRRAAKECRFTPGAICK
jgi:chromosome segregation ATPase